ncbi:MAG: DUF58 domain-containing protein [Halanaerobium sp.]|nr:DUF58 domain-containing protein [Halanaerobium sp.]
MKKQFKLYVELFLALALLAAYLHSAVLLFAALMAVFLIILAYTWNKFIFARVALKKSLSKKKVNIGEEVKYIIEIENKKLLPALYLKVEDELTAGIQFANSSFLAVMTRYSNFFQDIFNLKWYEKVTRAYELKATRRGLFRFGPGVIYYRDIFGIFQNNLKIEESLDLIVYPRILPLSKLGLEAVKPFGEKRRKGWIFADPTNLVGVRPYQITDDIRQVNWKASARHLQLESNIYQPSFANEVHLLLNIHTGKNWWEGIDRNNLELTVTCCASLAREARKEGCLVGLYANGGSDRNTSLTEIFPAKNSGHDEKIMTALAVMEPIRSVEFSSLLAREKSRIKDGSTVVVVTSFLDEETAGLLRYYHKDFNLRVVGVGKGMKEPGLPEIEFFHLAGEGVWDEIQILELAN